MPSLWFLTLLLKCIDFLSWPLLALGYPLCASIEAIENESHTETRNLISYWILLSLIYLFEYAFLKILLWFQYWHYMKLMIVAFLVMPDFGRASYVYDRLIRSCIYMNPQAVMSRIRNWKNTFVKKEDFMMQAEKYITQNGTEALEKLIATKNTAQSLVHAETRTADPTADRNEILKTNTERLLMEQKDIKDLEMIEKEQVPEANQANAASCSLNSNESTSSATVKTEKMAENTEHGTHPKTSASQNVQKEWTCAICQLTMPSEANLTSHLQGRKHKAACEALNTKTKATPAATEAGTTGASPSSKNEQTKWTCEICQWTMFSEASLKSHIYGKKHKAALEALKAKMENNKNFETVNSDVKNKNKDIDGNANKVQEVQKSSYRSRCEMCNVTCTSEVDLASHLQDLLLSKQLRMITIQTRNLMSYWILLSLIYLFEYAFLKLLQWFQYWSYMKLMIVVWLVIPDFGRATHVYNQLIWLCINMNPHVVMSRFRNWKMIFVKKDDFLMLAEKYIAENGSGALEKLIASKNAVQNLDAAETKRTVPSTEKNELQLNTAQNLDTETRKTVPSIEKNEAQQEHIFQRDCSCADKVNLPLEQKDIKILEMIEKDENKVPNGKPSSALEANAASCSLKPSESTLSDMAKTERVAAKYTEGGASKNFQKEWTCAMCQVTTTSKADLNSHLHGKLHKASCEALKAKNGSVTVKVFVKKNDDKSCGEPEKMINTTASNSLEQKITKVEQKNVENVKVQKYCYRPKRRTIEQENMSTSVVHAIAKVQELQKSSETSEVEMNESRFRCDMCDVNCSSEVDMSSHLNGRRHLVKIRLVLVSKRQA